jgi:hypothetical protein
MYRKILLLEGYGQPEFRHYCTTLSSKRHNDVPSSVHYSRDVWICSLATEKWCLVTTKWDLRSSGILRSAHWQLVKQYRNNACLTLEDGTDRLSRNVTNHQYRLCKTPEERRSHLHRGTSLKSRFNLFLARHHGSAETDGADQFKLFSLHLFSCKQNPD